MTYKFNSQLRRENTKKQATKFEQIFDFIFNYQKLLRKSGLKAQPKNKIFLKKSTISEK